jgi:hypothetical protein
VIVAQISDQMYFAGDAIAVRILLKREGETTRYLKVSGSPFTRGWEDLPDDYVLLAADEPSVTMVLPNDAARALLEALLRHYQGASDMHTVRADLLHERGRVDKLTDAVIRIASRGIAK